MDIPNSMQQLNIFQKFCDNQMKFADFIKAKGIIEDYYSLRKWKEFKENPVKYITSYSEVELYKWIVEKIDILDYKG